MKNYQKGGAAAEIKGEHGEDRERERESVVWKTTTTIFVGFEPGKLIE